MKTSWKTTVTGICAIVIALANAVIALWDGNLATNPDWTVIITTIATGIGLISARDNNVTSESAIGTSAVTEQAVIAHETEIINKSQL